MDDPLTLLDDPFVAEDETTWFDAVERSLSTDLTAWLRAVRVDGALDRDRSWRLLNWPEEAASLVVQTRRPELVVSSTVVFALLEASPLDRRDVTAVAGLTRRACTLADLNFTTLVREGCDRAGALGEQCIQWLWWAPDRVTSTHDEVGAGASFRFQRKKSTIDIAALERWAKGEE